VLSSRPPGQGGDFLTNVDQANHNLQVQIEPQSKVPAAHGEEGQQVASEHLMDRMGVPCEALDRAKVCLTPATSFLVTKLYRPKPAIEAPASPKFERIGERADLLDRWYDGRVPRETTLSASSYQTLKPNTVGSGRAKRCQSTPCEARHGLSSLPQWLSPHHTKNYLGEPWTLHNFVPSPMTAPQAGNRAIEVPLSKTITNFLPISKTAKISPIAPPPLTCGGFPSWGHQAKALASPLRLGASWDKDNPRMEYGAFPSGYPRSARALGYCG